jgi:hypothetical protein
MRFKRRNRSCGMNMIGYELCYWMMGHFGIRNAGSGVLLLC